MSTSTDTTATGTAGTAVTGIGRLFRAAAIAEACSWVGLLIGMFFKYVVVRNEIGVQIFGPIHGGLFVVYVIVTLLAARRLRWDAATLVVALVSSIPPLMTVWFERRAARQGRLRTS
jgi:integral membrane protein